MSEPDENPAKSSATKVKPSRRPSLKNRRAGLGLDRAREGGSFQLQPRDLAMPARAHLAETESAKTVFEPVDLVQTLGRDLGAVGKARRQAGKLRLVPGGKTELFRQLAHVALRHGRIDKRLARAVLLGRLQAGTVVAEVVGVGAKQNFLQPQALGHRLRDVEQLVLAVKAAVLGIHAEFGARQLVRFRDLGARADFRRQLQRGLAFAGRHGRRQRHHGNATFAEYVVGDLEH